MLIRIDVGSDRPLFEQVAGAVRARVAAGSLSVGDRLPAARELGEALDINTHTVLRAYQQLREEGLVDLRRGRGAVIASGAAPLVQLRDDIVHLVARAASLDIPPSALSALVDEVARHSADHSPLQNGTV
ncbi:GntR family transcriptional regulator [Microbacterium sp. YY-01]|uniref:GntR family transcriptional regulator n=1 Tax=Microbacterium sp. YY-01 TaxID=3421634 RepID=UPI003D17FB12